MTKHPIRVYLIFGTLAGAMCAMPAHAQNAAEATPVMLPLLMRWTHILSAIIMLGGTIFLRAVVMPAARGGLTDDVAMSVREVIHVRWRKVVPWLILAFLVSGFYNYLAVTRHAHEGEPLYHMLFGIKFLLSLGVFALASMLIGKRTLSMRLRKNAELWLMVLIVLALSVVLIAGYMKLMA